MRGARWSLVQALWITALFTTAAAANDPPVVEAIPVYLTYPGFPVSILLPASDPDSMSFSSDMLPEGSALDLSTGLFEWTPHESQFGAYVIPFVVTDDGEPPLETSGELPIKVVPLDQCIVDPPNCDPAAGCEPELRPLDESCCQEPPTIRVPDPEAACESGPALHLGRNLTGFGRLHNCDRFVYHTAQFGIRIRLHLEARCLDATQPIHVDESLVARYTDVDGVEQELEMYTHSEEHSFVDREDGWSQSLFNSRPVAVPTPLKRLKNSDGLLTVTATDAHGVSATEELRVILVLKEPPSLPDPGDDTIPPPSEEAACEGCHRPLTSGGEEREGIEDVHPWAAISCVGCHGGNADATTLATAHVPHGDAPQFIKNLSSDELDAIDLAYLRFVNPGDLRVAGQSCGLVGCHPEHVANVPLSVMTTYAGHYTLPRYLAGAQDRDAIYAAVDATDSDFQSESAPDGAIESFTALREVHPLADRSTLPSVIDTYLPKACPTCHLSAFGENKAAGTYRSSGCTACHMIYADDGLSHSEDPVIDKNFTPHPIRHELTTAIPVEQCAHCHFQGGRVGLTYRGIREGGFPPEQTPANGTTLGESLYGHGPDFYFSDEDDTNPVDETPPDLHFDVGMVCVDCHVGGDVHGDGNLYRSERFQTGIRCEDCHGTVRDAVEEDPADGFFKTSKGDPLERLGRSGPFVTLRLAMDPDTSLIVPQIHDLLEAEINPRMVKAMGVDENGFSHTDSIECYACHTSWRQTCFGCHITVDDSTSALNHTTGQDSPGLTSATRDAQSLDFYALGMNERGKLSPLCSSMSIFLSYIDESGVLQYEDKVRTSHDGKTGFGWNPFHHHTVSLVPQPCTRCHPAEDGEPDNSATLAATYGFGTGAFMVVDGDGVERDLSRLLDDEGNLVSDFPHPNTGPVPEAMRRRALFMPEPRSEWLVAALLATLARLASDRRRRSAARADLQAESRAA